MKPYAALLMAPLALSLSPLARAQEALPAGTILPVALTASLNGARARPGERITARVMQAVSIDPRFRIPNGARVIGHIVQFEPDSQDGAQLSLRFDKVVAKKHEIRLNAGLRAVASYVEIEAAQIPAAGPDAGTSLYSATTVQIGGDIRYGTGGPVMAGGTKVGTGVAGGVVARITTTPRSECAQGPSTRQPQSLWVFSSGACGIYGLPDLTIRESGLTQATGEIMLRSSRGTVKLPSGTGLLLQVVDGSHRQN
ncbi:MAG: hypothetical protein ACRD5K_06945 [Candidatus Acidiferrales bacterium]